MTAGPSSPSVAKSARVNPTTPILAVRYAIETGLAVATVAEETLMMRPHPRPCISGSNALDISMRSVKVHTHHALPELEQQLEMRASRMGNRHPSDVDIATLALRTARWIVAPRLGPDVSRGSGH